MESTGVIFVRGLPPVSVSPVVVIPDDVPSEVREDILNALAAEGSVDPTVRRVALWIANRAALRLHRQPSRRELAQAVLDSMHELSEYDDDPENREEYNRAVTSLVPAVGAAISPVTGQPKGRGDCDDLAVLYVALCNALGLRAMVIWIDQREADTNHVSAGVCVEGEAYEWAEPTIVGALVGEYPQAAADRIASQGRNGIGRS